MSRRPSLYSDYDVSLQQIAEHEHEDQFLPLKNLKSSQNHSNQLHTISAAKQSAIDSSQAESNKLFDVEFGKKSTDFDDKTPTR